MRQSHPLDRRSCAAPAFLTFAIASLAGCGGDVAPAAAHPALRIALVPIDGSQPIDEQIRSAQQAVRQRADVARIERLATLFISKARRSGDPGFYKQAEACADAMTDASGGRHAGALVRGHVRHALHDFAGAERIARELVAARGMFLDHGLLGDVLLDLGRLEDARTSYQRMLDLRPGLQSYARAAQIRWLAGDHDGCRQLLSLAHGAGSRRDPESLAWVLARRATLELQANDPATAARFADEALAIVADHPPALLARGRAALAAGDAAAAAMHLAAAAASQPLPEHLWAHADALRAAGDEPAAAAVEAELLLTGAAEDPRTFALWLATRGLDAPQARRLAEAELAVRQDPCTHDAIAIVLWRSGDVAGAEAAMQRALACGVRDARLFAHAACIAAAAGDQARAERYRAAAETQAAALLPSERQMLASALRRS